MSAFPGLPSVDRRLFIPETVWVVRDGRFVTLTRADEPEEWERVVAADEPIATKVKDGMWPTSSSTGPSMMARMIAALCVESDMRVLEIGTGTGYNAACLAELGAFVVTVEVDPEVAEHARGALRAAGLPGVVVISGDGEAGAPSHAPFDRVIATAAAHTVPYAWVEQTKPGGLIVVPWAATFHPDGPLAVLTVGTDGTAEGRFTEPSWFMPLHGQRLPQTVLHETRERWEAAGEPDVSRYGITVRPDGQSVWLDEPGTVVR
ncbi:protein-L-isoaspartate O-methyltransferase family protein [Actinomadura montaniterrae]|uniref:protein-L-isoaspartate O-methyltransferase family protein n=1 Tax=Actinomadura montaniterrae TaxID=1803903 RepID=UPI001CEFA72A|nr:methyltransferase domain-containing protein [Actinomadura montaniterrae]